MKIALKTSNGRYLTANADGTLNAKSAAISAQQTFRIVELSKNDEKEKEKSGNERPDFKQFALMTTWKTYVNIKPSDKTKIGYAASADPITSGKDKSSDSNSHKLIIRMQARNQKSYQRKVLAMSNGSKYGENYISRQVLENKAGRELDKDEVKFLKQAYAGTYTVDLPQK